MFSTLFFYIFSASVILVYGVGIKDLIQASEKPKDFLLYFLKTFFTVIFSVILTWLLTKYVFSKNNLTDLFPFFLVFICISFCILFSFLINLIFKKDIKEFSLSFLISFISVNEGFSLVNAIFIAIASSLSFYLLIPVLYSIKKRINSSTANSHLKSTALVLLSIALLLMILFAFNISWFNFGVIQ